MRIAILGHTGMLGGMVKRYLEDKYVGGHVNIITIPSRFRVTSEAPIQSDLEYYLGDKKIDYVVNCIGAIKPRFGEGNNVNEIHTNAVFPRQLADWCELHSTLRGEACRLIHITTDCVYSGQEGNYSEEDEHDALDEYGKSKSLGEPTNCIVLRTSIIGPEWGGNARSLISWVLKQKTATGYTNHSWNGLTTLELAKCIDKTIFQLPWIANGVFHLFSTTVTKYELLEKIAKAFGHKLELKEGKAAGLGCDRTLGTTEFLNERLDVAGIDEMLQEVAKWAE